MARKIPAQIKRQDEDARQRHVTRLVRWAELMAEVKKLESRIRSAGRDGVIDEAAAGNALDGLQVVREDIRDAVPEE